MIKVLNLSPNTITDAQKDLIKESELCEWCEVVVNDVNVQIDFNESLEEQAFALVKPYIPENEKFLVRLEVIDTTTLSIMNAIHKKIGYFPRIITFKRDEEGFLTWAIVDLQITILREE
jgi:thioredoxin-related protein